MKYVNITNKNQLFGTQEFNLDSTEIQACKEN